MMKMIFEFKTEGSAQLIHATSDDGTLIIGQVFKEGTKPTPPMPPRHYEMVDGYNIIIINVFYQMPTKDLSIVRHTMADMADWYLENKITPNKKYYDRYKEN